MSRFKQPQSFSMPEDWDKMPLGIYLRKGRGGRWHIGGQKSELPAGAYEVLGPIHIPDGPLKLPSLDFNGLNAAIDGVIQAFK